MINNFRLPTNTKPIHYHIIIKPENNIFAGICYITYNKFTMENHIMLNGANLKIISVELENNKCLDIIYDIQYERIKLIFDNMPNTGIIKICYLGQITDSMVGVYRSKISDSEYVISTQFEPVFARHCFPCFDEPHFKTTFQLEIYALKNKIVISNTEKISEKINWILDHPAEAGQIGKNADEFIQSHASIYSSAKGFTLAV